MSGRAVTGEGTVYQRKDGRWVAAAWVPSVGGKVQRVFTYSSTRTAAKAKLRELTDRADRGILATPQSLTVAVYLAEWLEHVKQHVRSSTWTAYEGNTRLHIVPRIGKKKIALLGARDVRLMLDDLRRGGAGPRTIQYVHATLRAAMEHAYREELVNRNVVKLVRVEAPRPALKVPLSVEEARALLGAVTQDRHQALWVIMLMLGLRRSEVCGLRWEHVDLTKQTLRVAQSVQRVDGKLQQLPTKTRRSNRTVPVPAKVVAALRAHEEASGST
jgi:integrase